VGVLLKLLITGSSGFVGQKVVRMAQQRQFDVLKQQRSASAKEDVIICDINSDTEWSSSLSGVECVVHCAARVHQMKESLSDARKAYQQVNVDGTLNLARQAVQAGVKRFVFISSIKVNGEFSPDGKPFIEKIGKAPSDLYGQSKYQAELGLKKIASETGLEIVIIRPPLVYGPGVKANFATMMKWVKKGIPLPLGAVKNQRSLVYIDNLVDLMITCCDHPNAAGEVFLVSDGYDVTTTQLLKAIAYHMSCPSRLLPISTGLMTTCCSLIGKQALAQRLFGSLQLDISNTTDKLSWKPPVSFDNAIRQTVQDFLQREPV
jgi:nucleoside-diphosphate-sugar epimerase